VSFSFATAGRVVFGDGQAAVALPGLLAAAGSRILLLTGGDPARHGDLLGALPPRVGTFTVIGEPTLDTARAGVAAATQAGAEVLLALGGGSVIDTAKAVAMLVANGGDPADYLDLGPVPRPVRRPSLPVVAVPTTGGTGAEVTANAVLADPGRGVKVSLRSPSLVPAAAVVDPELTLGCPPAVTAAAGLDALTQCLEPFVSPQANPVTDGLAREGLAAAATGLRRAYADGTDLDARRAMALCGLLGGMALANAKLGAVHGFAGVVGGRAALPHGYACAALLVPVTAANIRALSRRQPGHPALDRYREAARILTGRPDATVEDGLAWLAATVAELGGRGLAAAGLGPEDAEPVVAATARASSTRGNPIELSGPELHAAYAAAL
jgi:alcohol dehydrogenase class IV